VSRNYRDRRPAAPPPRASGPPRNVLIAGGAVVALLLLWFLWPSSISDVRNLDSSGTKIIAFGDSLTAGYGAAPGEDYPAQLGKLIGSEIVNAGVSGDTTDSALARIEDVTANDPRIVIVGLGGNDYLRNAPIATTEQNLRAIIRRIQEAGAMVILLGYEFPGFRGDYGAMYERIADEEKCLLLPDLLDGILSNESLKSDAIHPNGRGYAVMAERVADPTKKLIEKAKR
jgi:acyl-CoA thioesterase I